MSDTITTAELAALKARYADPDFHPDTLRRITAYECPRLIAAVEATQRERDQFRECFEVTGRALNEEVNRCEAARARIEDLKAQLDEANFEAARQRHACAEAQCENESLRKQLTEARRQLALEQMP